MHRGRIRVQGTPAEPIASLPEPGGTLDGVFRVYSTDRIEKILFFH